MAKQITFEHDGPHGVARVTLRVPDGANVVELSPAQGIRVVRAICGIDDCCCGWGKSLPGRIIRGEDSISIAAPGFAGVESDDEAWGLADFGD